MALTLDDNIANGGEAEAYWKWRDEQTLARRSGETVREREGELKKIPIPLPILIDEEKRWDAFGMGEEEGECESATTRNYRFYCIPTRSRRSHSQKTSTTPTTKTDKKSLIFILKIFLVLLLTGIAVGLAIHFSHPNRAASYSPGVLITSLDASGVEHTVTTHLSKTKSSGTHTQGQGGGVVTTPSSSITKTTSGVQHAGVTKPTARALPTNSMTSGNSSGKGTKSGASGSGKGQGNRMRRRRRKIKIRKMVAFGESRRLSLRRQYWRI